MAHKLVYTTSSCLPSTMMSIKRCGLAKWRGIPTSQDIPYCRMTIVQKWLVSGTYTVCAKNIAFKHFLGNFTKMKQLLQVLCQGSLLELSLEGK